MSEREKVRGEKNYGGILSRRGSLGALANPFFNTIMLRKIQNTDNENTEY